MTAINPLFMLTSLAASAVAYVHPPWHHYRLFSRLRRTSSSLSMSRPDRPRPYAPPRWAEGALTNPPPHGRLRLANLPTPLHAIVGAGSSSASAAPPPPTRAGGILARLRDLDVRLYVKRDDATGGVELGGNKVRKLEFLLADALADGRRCDSVVTIGGEQSNHCRATAAARCVPLASSAVRMFGAAPSDTIDLIERDPFVRFGTPVGWWAFRRT